MALPKQRAMNGDGSVADQDTDERPSWLESAEVIADEAYEFCKTELGRPHQECVAVKDRVLRISREEFVRERSW